MAVTTNYSWNLPTVGGNQDTWGDLLNANWTALDTLLGGGTAITGIDINSGSIDGTVIGGASAAAGSFTTLSASSGASVTGTVTVTGNVSVTGTVDGRDVSADGAKLDGIESGATADQTAAEILALTKTVDGSGSGLDADLLDGQHGSYYYPASNPNGYTSNVGDITGVTAGGGISGGGTSGTVTISHADTSSQSSVNNSGNTVIQDITLDTYGHVTSLTSKTIDIPASSPIMTTSTGTNIPVGAYVFGIDSNYTSHNLGSTFSAATYGITVYGGSSQFVITYGTWITLGREGGNTFMYQRIA